MPFRVLEYDYIRYKEQLEPIIAANRAAKAGKKGEFLSGFQKTDKLIPVITLVL